MISQCPGIEMVRQTLHFHSALHRQAVAVRESVSIGVNPCLM